MNNSRRIRISKHPLTLADISVVLA